MIEFVGKFDSSVTKSLNNRQFKKFWWLFVVFSVLFIFTGVIGLILPEDESDMVFGIVMIIIGVIFTPVCILLTRILQKKIDKSMSILSTETTETYRFYQDKLIITQSKGEEFEAVTTAKYSYIYQAEETATHYFLKISKMQSHVINKANLTQGTLEELNAILSANLGAKFKAAK